jgi:hypothetical protein
MNLPNESPTPEQLQTAIDHFTEQPEQIDVQPAEAAAVLPQDAAERKRLSEYLPLGAMALGLSTAALIPTALGIGHGKQHKGESSSQSTGAQMTNIINSNKFKGFDQPLPHPTASQSKEAERINLGY